MYIYKRERVYIYHVKESVCISIHVKKGVCISIHVKESVCLCYVFEIPLFC